ncbi:hypothetical protein PCCS19_16430 [Paenibacillus sp. CCS19]|uniref:type I polyketide synthase n=1 Tax=Paenibacillus sp. CCS19 TaxID=3158387 RepID=UPI0025615E8C|nr:SDR family NAD(P)-dependent oxidoreductase [Paenibacillus cellulosilyticus]GMK38589.1 hypothetical protein PCCS19_16430 [Paenibacillus cellulosilyticus]
MSTVRIDLSQFHLNRQPVSKPQEQESRAQQASAASFRSREVAIIGLSVQLPRSEHWSDFWENVASGIDCTGGFPEERQAFTRKFVEWIEQDPAKTTYMDGAYFDHVDGFDAKFFRMLPTEASLMSPDQRLFLESVWHALEDAGYGGSKLAGSNTGVYVGHVADLGGYNYRQMLDEWVDPQHKPASIAGNLSAIIASRISYLLDLKGPALVIDTACSSSLVAVHTACRAIRSGECEMAIAGGVRLSLLPIDKATDKVGMESSDGKTRAFDDGSDGAALGEGVVTVLLKPLERAIEDRDHIYAVIKGTAVNQDGNSIGITAPNVQAQADLYVQAWKDAGIEPTSISYIETHGTGTVIGDPIEIEGLRRAFGRFTDKKQFCAVSSLKSNVGHSYQTAGIAGMAKAALALKFGVIPPTIHFNRPNRKIRFTDSPVYVNTAPRRWRASEVPRRAGVSSFGFSGTNCHVVLEEAPAAARRQAAEWPKPNILALSAMSEEVLYKLIWRYDEFLNSDAAGGFSLEEISYTANTGRGHYRCRLAIVAESREQLRDLIAKLRDEGVHAVDSSIHYSGKKESNSGAQLTELEILADSAVERLQQQSDDRFAWDTLADLYARGVNVDFEALYAKSEIYRVPLPVYPFDRQLHWLDDPNIRRRTKAVPEAAKEAASAASAEAASAPHPLEDRLYYGLEWVPMPNDAALNRVAPKREGKTLVLTSGCAMGKAIVDALHLQGGIVIEAKFGDAFQQIDDTKLVLSGDEADYDRLVAIVGAHDISQIVHAAGWTPSGGPATIEQLGRSQQLGTYCLLSLVQALVRAGCRQPVDIALVANNVYRIDGTETELHPEQAALFGLGKVVHSEYDNLRCRVIDLDSETSIDELIEQLSNEKQHYAVGIRNKTKYIERFTPIDLSDYNDKPLEIRDQGVYLITGGTGDLGLEAARYLASQHRVHLFLVSRSEFPERERWDELAAGENRELARKIELLRQLEASGSTVTCAAANVSDLASMESLLCGIRERFGGIHGVIHSAGVAGDGFLIAKPLDTFNEVFKPKVHGTWVLDHLTADDALDFFILYSSGASLIGEAGQGDYCAANSYLDAFAAYRNAKGMRTLTINWVKWREIGLAVGKGSNRDGLYKTLGTKEAMDAFDVIVSRDIERVMVGRMNLASEMLPMMELFPFVMADEIGAVVEEAKLKRDAAFAAASRRLEQATPAAESAPAIRMNGRESGYSDIEKQLAAVYQEVLGFKEINIHDNFFELGGNSIMLNLMFARLQQLFPGRLKLTDLFTYTSISRLAGFLSEPSIAAASGGAAIGKSKEAEKLDISRMFDDMESGKLSIEEMLQQIR